MSLARTLADEWGPHGIRVNCVAPDITAVPRLTDNLPGSDEDALALLDAMAVSEGVPLRRFGRTHEDRRAAPLPALGHVVVHDRADPRRRRRHDGALPAPHWSRSRMSGPPSHRDELVHATANLQRRICCCEASPPRFGPRDQGWRRDGDIGAGGRAARAGPVRCGAGCLATRCHRAGVVLEGNAARYQLTGDEYSIDGRWEATPAAPRVPDRVLMARPAADTFNGTVVVVWNNVSSGVDGIYAGPGRPRMLADGYAVLGVSAQKVGIDGPLGLIATDADRYGTLHHPGDDHSYDIFTQATALASTDERLLGGLTTRHVVAAGGVAISLPARHPAQRAPPSGHRRCLHAHRLRRERNARRHVERVTGFAEVPDNSTVNILPFRSHRLRDDLDVKVFAVNSETEACLFTANHNPLGPPADLESAGTSHIGLSQIDLPDMGNDAPCRGSFAPAITAAYEHLQRWLTDGTLPRASLGSNGPPTARRSETSTATCSVASAGLTSRYHGTHRGEARPGDRPDGRHDAVRRRDGALPVPEAATTTRGASQQPSRPWSPPAPCCPRTRPPCGTRWPRPCGPETSALCTSAARRGGRHDTAGGRRRGRTGGASSKLPTAWPHRSARRSSVTSVPTSSRSSRRAGIRHGRGPAPVPTPRPTSPAAGSCT